MAIGWQVPANWWTRDHNLCIAISWITVARALRVDYRKVETQGPVKVIRTDVARRGLITSNGLLLELTMMLPFGVATTFWWLWRRTKTRRDIQGLIFYSRVNT